MTPQPLHAADAFATLDARPAPSLVIFTAPACGACRRLKAVLATLDAPPLPGLAVYDINAEEAPGLLEELAIQHLPALFLYQEGDFHAAIEVELTAAALTAALQAAHAAPPQPDRERSADR